MLTENIKYGRTTQYGPWNETPADRAMRSHETLTDHNGNLNWYRDLHVEPYLRGPTENTPYYQPNISTVLVPRSKKPLLLLRVDVKRGKEDCP